MQQLMTVGGLLAAVIGVLLCAVAGLARMFGVYSLAGLEALTLLQVGIAFMVMACLLRLYRSDF